MQSHFNTSLVRAFAQWQLKLVNLPWGSFGGSWASNVPFNRLVYIFEESQPPGRIYWEDGEFVMLQGRWLLVPGGKSVRHEQFESGRLLSIHFNLENMNGMEFFSGCDKCFQGDADGFNSDFAMLCQEQTDCSQVLIANMLICCFAAKAIGENSAFFRSREEHFARFGKLYDIFRQKPYRDFSVSEMAGIMAMGKESFIKHFTEENGVPPKLFFNRIRAAAAAKELLYTTLTVREIAYKFSFTDEFYFSRFFKRHFGMSPGAYKKLILKH